MYLTDALALATVPRWTVVRTVRPQSVAEHCFNVSIIVHEILEREPQLALSGAVRPYNLVFHALHHDIDECVTGDIPRHAKNFLRPKRDLPAMVKGVPSVGINVRELDIVKFADLMEAATFINMNGVGAHALAVGRRLHLELHDYLKQPSISDLILQPELLIGMYDDIVRERERDLATGSRDSVE